MPIGHGHGNRRQPRLGQRLAKILEFIGTGQKSWHEYRGLQVVRFGALQNGRSGGIIIIIIIIRIAIKYGLQRRDACAVCREYYYQPSEPSGTDCTRKERHAANGWGVNAMLEVLRLDRNIQHRLTTIVVPALTGVLLNSREETDV